MPGEQRQQQGKECKTEATLRLADGDVSGARQNDGERENEIRVERGVSRSCDENQSLRWTPATARSASISASVLSSSSAGDLGVIEHRLAQQQVLAAPALGILADDA